MKMNSERDGLNILNLLHQNRNERRQQRRTHLNDGDFNHGILHRRDGIGQMNGSKTILLLFIGWMTLDRWTVPKPSSTKTTTFAQIHRFHEHADNPISKNANTFYHCISEAELVRCSLEAVIKFRQAVLHKTSASQPNALSSSMHNAAGQIHRFQSNHRSHMVVPHWQTRRCNKC